MNYFPKEIFDHVLDAGIYTNPVSEQGLAALAAFSAAWSGGCSAAAKCTDSGHTLVGRNMDLNISHKPAYVMRTKSEGGRSTVGLSYFFAVVPDYEEVRKNGLDERIHALLPFLCTDVMNDAGLYMETNMRTGECWPNGASKFGCTGTNPGAKLRIPAGMLPRLVCENCTTVAEALEYVKTLDLFTAKDNATAWNFCFMLADATGRHGLLEVACNRLFWHEGQPVQTNFYIAPELSEVESYKAGIGRYETLTAGLGAVQSAEQMYELIKTVSYFQMYDPDNCRFDPRSEYVGTAGFCSCDYLMDDVNREAVYDYMRKVGSEARSLSREQQQDANKYWESAFTIVADCTEKTLFVRFFEDESRTLKLDFSA